jgi:hypothetical protein
MKHFKHQQIISWFLNRGDKHERGGTRSVAKTSFNLVLSSLGLGGANASLHPPGYASGSTSFVFVPSVQKPAYDLLMFKKIIPNRSIFIFLMNLKCFNTVIERTAKIIYKSEIRNKEHEFKLVICLTRQKRL